MSSISAELQGPLFLSYLECETSFPIFIVECLYVVSVFRSNPDDMTKGLAVHTATTTTRSNFAEAKYNSSTGHSVQMYGLPFRATEQDVMNVRMALAL